MSQKHLFLLKIESVKIQPYDKLLSTVNEFNPYDIKTIVENHLKKANLKPDYDSFQYILIDGFLHVQGYAVISTGDSPDILFA